MGVLPDPISGNDELSNSAGIDDHWSCPNCYADHFDYGEGAQVRCDCGATLRLEIEHQPVCRAVAIGFEAELSK